MTPKKPKNPKHESIWSTSPTMRLYEAVRWGNDLDGEDGNGPDTNHLVIAPDHATAAKLVERAHERVELILELGLSAGLRGAPGCVLRGPYIQYAYNSGHFPRWGWDEHVRAWMCTPVRDDGIASGTYPDDARAAAISYSKRQLNGPSERWHPDGSPLSHETFRNDSPLGVHEWWYPGNRPARRIEYVYPERYILQVITTTWNEYGEVIEHTTDTGPLRIR